MSIMSKIEDPVGQLLTECSLPTSEPTPALAQTLLALASVLFRRAAQHAPADDDGLVQEIGEALVRHDTVQDPAACFRLWTPSIAETSRHIERGDHAAALRQIAAMLAEAGLTGDFTTRPLAIDRLWRDGTFHAFDSAGQATHIGADRRWFELPGMRDKFVLPTREVILGKADVEIVWPAPVDHGVPNEVIEQAHESMAEAVRWIAEISPEHLTWVDRLVCGFAITEMPDDSDLSSGSYRSRPGVVHISFPLEPVMVAETLIHEASHQYFLLLNGVVPMVRPGTTAEVFSPIKGCNRPVDRCTLAHHACFNIWDFMRRGVASRYGDEARKSMELMARFTDALGRNIQTSDCLTDAGSGFVGSLQSIFVEAGAARA
jgi:hypothetical protein